MSIQSLKGAAGQTPSPVQVRPPPAPATDATAKPSQAPPLPAPQASPQAVQSTQKTAPPTSLPTNKDAKETKEQALKKDTEQEQIKQAMEKLRSSLPPKASSLQFSLDKTSGQTVIKVIDTDTGDTIRQIPSEEMLEISNAVDKMASKMKGVLLQQKA